MTYIIELVDKRDRSGKSVYLDGNRKQVVTDERF